MEQIDNYLYYKRLHCDIVVAHPFPDLNISNAFKYTTSSPIQRWKNETNFYSFLYLLNCQERMNWKPINEIQIWKKENVAKIT